MWPLKPLKEGKRATHLLDTRAKELPQGRHDAGLLACAGRAVEERVREVAMCLCVAVPRGCQEENGARRDEDEEEGEENEGRTRARSRSDSSGW